MQILHRKLKRLKPVLRSFSRKHFSNIYGRVLEARHRRELVQEEILKNPAHSQLVQPEKSLSTELFDLMKPKESFYRQKSRIQWPSRRVI